MTHKIFYVKSKLVQILSIFVQVLQITLSEVKDENKYELYRREWEGQVTGLKSVLTRYITPFWYRFIIDLLPYFDHSLNIFEKTVIFLFFLISSITTIRPLPHTKLSWKEEEPEIQMTD